MRKPTLRLAACLLFVAACSSNNLGTPSNGGDAGGGGDDGGKADGGAGTSNDGAHSGCDQYLRCVGDATPDALPIALQAYGPIGTCWGGDGSLESVCASACASSMAELHKLYPSVASCGSTLADGGMDGGSDLGLSGACESCAEAQCSGPLNACESDANCTGFASCAEACAPEDNACVLACQEKYDPTTNDALGKCLAHLCAGPCSG